jgi:hypothetical protein
VPANSGEFPFHVLWVHRSEGASGEPLAPFVKKDVIKGGPGFDLIYVDDGDTRDRIYGGKGRDKCYVDARSEAISGCSRVIVVHP